METAKLLLAILIPLPLGMFSKSRAVTEAPFSGCSGIQIAVQPEVDAPPDKSDTHAHAEVRAHEPAVAAEHVALLLSGLDLAADAQRRSRRRRKAGW